MKFRFFSDLHLDRDIANSLKPKLAGVADIWTVPIGPDDADRTLILAGDLWEGSRPILFRGESWLGALSKRFKAVVAVLGNHDYYGEHIRSLPLRWKRMLRENNLHNVHLLEISAGVQSGSVVLDGVRILGGTFWTDMNRRDPRVVLKFDHEIGIDGRPVYNDRNYIRSRNYAKFSSRDWLDAHQDSVNFLKLALAVGDEPVLLVTHHAPCLLSAPPRSKTDILSSYLYGSDLSDLILDHPRVVQAIHGHTHEVYDYQMGDVRIRCNPRGYAPSMLVNDFSLSGYGEI